MPERLSLEVPDLEEALEISYFDVGTFDHTLLCLHGIQGSKHSFEPLLGSSLTEQFRVVVPDLPGFGDSGWPISGSFDLSDQVERLVTFMDMLEIEKFSVLGHSLGGMLGTLLLEAVPQRVSKLVSLEGNLRRVDCGETGRVSEMNFVEFETQRLPELKNTEDPYCRRGLAKVSAKAFFETSKTIVAWSESERLLQILGQTSNPVLFVRGGESPFPTEPCGNHVKNIVVQGETHFTLGRSVQVLQAASQFLAEKDG